MQIINKSFNINEFKDYVNSLIFKSWKPEFLVVHNTSSPTESQYKSWHARDGWTIEQWGRNLASYYSGLGWNGCPHLFVCYDKILVLNPLDKHGTHTPSWNNISWGIETAAEFDSEPFEGGIKDNLIAATAILCDKANFNPIDFKLGVKGIHFHKEDYATTHKNCPGKNLVKSTFVANVATYMNKNFNDSFNINNSDHPHAISEKVQLADTNSLTIEELTSYMWVQQQLNRLKITTPLLIIDGIKGVKTDTAIKTFQWENGLAVDGIAGPLTRLKLKSLK